MKFMPFVFGSVVLIITREAVPEVTGLTHMTKR